MSNSEFPQTFALWLRRHRESRGHVLRDVSEGTGIDLTLLSRLEGGERAPTIGQVDRLSKFFGVEPDVAHTLRVKAGILNKYAADPAMPEAIRRLAEEAVQYKNLKPSKAR